VAPDHDLISLRVARRSLELTARIWKARVCFGSSRRTCDCAGDTTTTLAAGAAAFYQRSRCATWKLGCGPAILATLPEEMNRLLTSRIAICTLRLLRRGRQSRRPKECHETALVTGNTGIDAVLYVRDALESATHWRRVPCSIASGLIW